jgi:hypothetical protein
MDQTQGVRPVDQPIEAQSPEPAQQSPIGSSAALHQQTSARGRKPLWPEGTLEQAITLQRMLAIDDRQWHALKGQRSRRAAEQLAGALVQLVAQDASDPTSAVEARIRAIALTSNALAWLKGELRDPGCPDHGH